VGNIMREIASHLRSGRAQCETLASALHLQRTLCECGQRQVSGVSGQAAGGVDYRILGPLEIMSDDGLPVTPRGRRERALVAVLLLYAGSPCRRDLLVRALWGYEPPADPATALRVCVCRARSAVGQGLHLVTLDGAYRADPPPGGLDLARFRDLLAEAGSKGRHGDLPCAMAALQLALACWRQPPLADIPDVPEVASERACLLEQRRLAELALADVLLTLGQHERIVPDLHARVVADPLSVRAWTQLMLALNRCGRRSEALAAYARARHALREHPAAQAGELQAVLAVVLEDQPPGGAASLPIPIQWPGLAAEKAPLASSAIPAA
jgi:DNA-binding SARP family transcriptional activator